MTERIIFKRIVWVVCGTHWRKNCSHKKNTSHLNTETHTAAAAAATTAHIEKGARTEVTNNTYVPRP